MNIVRSSIAISGMAGLLLLTACNGSTSGTTDGTSSASSARSVASAATSSKPSSAAASAATSKVTDANARVIAMTSTDWVFSPTSITAKKGEKIIVRLTNNDGIHSFGAMDLGINVRINPGETKDIEIPTDKAGTFSFRCLVPCGPGHKDMVGTIVIS